jgi:hypothetical protein
MKKILHYIGCIFLALFSAFMAGHRWENGSLESIAVPILFVGFGIVVIFCNFVRGDNGPTPVENLPKDTVFRIVGKMGKAEHEEGLGTGGVKRTTYYLYVVSRQGAGNGQGMGRFVFVSTTSKDLETLDEFVVCSHSSFSAIGKYKPQVHTVLAE